MSSESQYSTIINNNLNFNTNSLNTNSLNMNNFIKLTVNNAEIDMNTNIDNNIFMLDYSKWNVIQQYLIRSVYIMVISNINNLFDEDFINIFTSYLGQYQLNIDNFNVDFDCDNLNKNNNILIDNELTRFNCIEYIGYTNYNKLSMEYLHDSYIFGKFKKLNEYQKCIMHLRRIYPQVNSAEQIMKITHNNFYGNSIVDLNVEYLKENYMDISQDFANSFEVDEYLLSLLEILGIYPDRFKYIGYSREFIRLSYHKVNSFYELLKIPRNYNQFNYGAKKYSIFNADLEMLHSFISRCSNLSDNEYNFTAQLI